LWQLIIYNTHLQTIAYNLLENNRAVVKTLCFYDGEKKLNQLDFFLGNVNVQRPKGTELYE